MFFVIRKKSLLKSLSIKSPLLETASAPEIGYKISILIRPTNGSDNLNKAIIFAEPVNKKRPLGLSVFFSRSSSITIFNR